MERIIIIGCGGSGKSMLAGWLGEKLNLPVIHLDQLFWRPGWVKAPHEEWISLHESAVSQQRWIIDGNFASTLGSRLAACDTVIFMDFSRWRCLYNIVKRLVKYMGRTRPDLCEGCPERVDWEFIRWIWKFQENVRPNVLARLHQVESHVRLLTVCTPQEVKLLKRMVERVHA